MNKCKNCLNTGALELIKDYQYQFEEDYPIEIIDVFKCSICDAIHWEDNDNKYYEFLIGSKTTNQTKAVSGWAKSYNV
jgi:hypothetical protein